jgi:Flp pilus assembly protein TadD
LLRPWQEEREDVVAELAQSYLAMGQPQKAAAAWAELFALQPLSAKAAAEAGLCLARAGDTKEARRYLDRARAVDPKHPSVTALSATLHDTKDGQ